MKNYFEEFYQRYESLKSELGIKDIVALNLETLTSILKNESQARSDSKNAQTLNNLVMAGLGMGTLYLRMGAVLMIAEKTKQGVEPDVSFLKVIADKLIHKLPADGEWKDIWVAYLAKNASSEWNKILDSTPSIPKTDGKFYESFVTFRNNIVHQDIIIKSDLSNSEIDEILKGLKILDAMSRFRDCFKACIIDPENKELYFQYGPKTEKLKISPFVQTKMHKEPVGDLPYLFQGRYYKGSKFINTEGAETKEEKDDSVDETFEKIKKNIALFNGDKAFDFKEKLSNYNEWFIGRENEVNAIMEWIIKETDKNVLPIYAPAGLGKGALVAKVKDELDKKNIKHLIHFCGSGAANNLQAILYSLIIQGKNYEYLDQNNNKQKKNIWNNLYLPPKLQARFDRLPTQYIDVIELFQALLKITDLESDKKNKLTVEESSRLVIILDGLDEAAVSDHSKRISDWFYTYDENGKRKEKWKSPDHIKWLFTYRQTAKENKEGFQFEYHEFNTHELPIVQPLIGLSEEAVKNGFLEEFENFEPTLTREFLESIIQKGAVK
jgi:hypothetical protein